MDLAGWNRAGQRLGVLGRCSSWWLGDWIRYGNAKFGQRYALASKITGYDTQTLTNMVYVASRFEVSRRRENLSWSHHETVASLDANEQNHWLDRAAEDKLSVADLRIELRSQQKGHDEPSRAATTDDAEKRQGASITCPNCGHEIPSSLFIAQLKDPPTPGESVVGSANERPDLVKALNRTTGSTSDAKH
jgi:hypothetical protein